jgi:tRNA(Ile)-lysidine synthase
MPEKAKIPAHPLEVCLAASWPPDHWKDVTVLVAVSGGSDSVALLRGLAAVKLPGEGRLIVAHINHKLRGADSDADQAFVEELSVRLRLESQVATSAVETTGGGHGQGLESLARKARYAMLEEIAGRVGARFVVTAHTADDQAETILHRVLRGTGLRGLAGISRSRRIGRATLLRPLLTVSHEELVSYLAKRRQPFRTDASNTDVRFTRNRIRKELLPILAAHYNPAIVAALLRLGELAGESQSLLDTMVREVTERCLLGVSEGEAKMDLKTLALQPPYLVREVLRIVWRRQGWPLAAMGFAEWESLAVMMAAAPTGKKPKRSLDRPRKRMFPGGVLIEILDGDSSVRLSRRTGDSL